MNTIQLDDQQLSVLQCLQEGGNCSIEANPGTGKTTTMLNIASLLPHLRFLIITYNNSLQGSTSNDIQNMQLTNVDVFTYHQFLRVKYDPDVCDDCGLMKVLGQDRRFRLRPPNLTIPQVVEDVKALDELPTAAFMAYDVIVIDEIQDMSRPYFLAALLGMIDNQRSRFQLVVMGDARQVVYTYRGADKRFLTLAKEVFGSFHRLKMPGTWETITFTKTYRLPPSVCWFINEAMFHHDDENHPLISSETMETSTRNHPILVFIDELPECLKMVLETLNQIFSSRPDCPKEEIVFCCGSFKDEFVKTVMQILTLNGFPIFVPSGLESSSDPSMYQGRIRFYTRHSIKGLTCDYLIQLNMNNSYYTIQQYLNPLITESALQRHVTPPPHFVSLSRARIRLVIINLFSVQRHRSSPSLRESHILPPYLNREIWQDAIDGKNEHFQVLGKHAQLCFSQSMFCDGVQLPDDEKDEDDSVDVPFPPSKRQKVGAGGDVLTRKFLDVTQLCAFLSSDFISHELWDIHSWFDKKSLGNQLSSSSAADYYDDNWSFTEISEEDLPSKVPNIYNQLEDVSDLTGKTMAYFGYDYLRERSASRFTFANSSSKSEFANENGGLDKTLRQLQFSSSVVGGDSYNSKFGNTSNREKRDELQSRFFKVQSMFRVTIQDYLHSVAVLEALTSGMFHRVLHFKEENMNWIPESAVHSCKKVIDHFIPKTEDESGYLCEHFMRTNLKHIVPNYDIQLKGTVDMISRNYLFEWKYKTSLQLEDLLQLIIYMYLYKKVKGDMEYMHKKFVLLNIRTGTLYTLKRAYHDRALNMVENLIYYKMTNSFKEEDEDVDSSFHNEEQEEDEISRSDEVFIQRHSLANLAFLSAPATATTETSTRNLDL